MIAKLNNRKSLKSSKLVIIKGEDAIVAIKNIDILTT